MKKTNLNAAFRLTKNNLISATALLALQAVCTNVQAQKAKQPTVTSTEKAPGFVKMEFTKMEYYKMSTFYKCGCNAGLIVEGVSQGSTVFKNTKGELFTLNKTTGDMIFIKPEEWAKSEYFAKVVHIKNWANKTASSSAYKMTLNLPDVRVLGLNSEGAAIMQNSKGEKFYLNPENGDMVIVK